jgi:threonine dehydrogenase-like Zn-dependent dehydrogenase
LRLAPAVINEVTIIGSRCGPFRPALDSLAGGDIAVAPLIERTYPLAEGTEALAAAARRGALKILLDCR